MRWPRTRYMFTSACTCTTFSFWVTGSANALRSAFQRAGSYGTARLANTSS